MADGRRRCLDRIQRGGPRRSAAKLAAKRGVVRKSSRTLRVGKTASGNGGGGLRLAALEMIAGERGLQSRR
jgi:hypothetical protein